MAVWNQILRSVARLYPLLLLVLSAFQRGRRSRHGLPALTAVFAPYLYLPLLLLAPAARRRDARLLRALLLICAVTYTRCFAPKRRPRPARPTPGNLAFNVTSWNILFSQPRVEDILRFLAGAPGQVVALQELTAMHVARIGRDPALARRFPYQILLSHGYGAGMALLSRYPILEQGTIERPPTIWARLDLGDGHRLILVNAHPTFFPPRMAPDSSTSPSSLARMRHLLDPRLLRYNPEYRDRGIALVRALVEPLLRQDHALLVVGDFNVTEREPAYDELTAGLHDAHRSAGHGSGHTWRPEWLTRLPLPVLRIDYMLSSPAIRPLRLSVDCLPRGSDHCILHGEFELIRRSREPSLPRTALKQMDGKASPRWTYVQRGKRS